MSKPIDKSKKSNIKCENCEFWNENIYGGQYKFEDLYKCENENSLKEFSVYWHRCKQFKWKGGAV